MDVAIQCGGQLVQNTRYVALQRHRMNPFHNIEHNPIKLFTYISHYHRQSFSFSVAVYTRRLDCNSVELYSTTGIVYAQTIITFLPFAPLQPRGLRIGCGNHGIFNGGVGCCLEKINAEKVGCGICLCESNKLPFLFFKLQSVNE